MLVAFASEVLKKKQHDVRDEYHLSFQNPVNFAVNLIQFVFVQEFRSMRGSFQLHWLALFPGASRPFFLSQF